MVSTLRGASAEEYFDLFRDVAEAYWAQGDARSALELLLPLRAVEACDAPPLWERIAACRVRLGDVAGAVSEYESVLTQHPGHPEALTALAKLLPELVRGSPAVPGVLSLPRPRVRACCRRCRFASFDSQSAAPSRSHPEHRAARTRRSALLPRSRRLRTAKRTQRKRPS